MGRTAKMARTGRTERMAKTKMGREMMVKVEVDVMRRAMARMARVKMMKEIVAVTSSFDGPMMLALFL